jgi:selenide,water dikinase
VSGRGRRLILIGGGHAHLFVLEAFARVPLDGLEVRLVSPVRLAPYSGMMPGVIAGHYRYEQGCVDLAPLARACGASWHETRAAGLDPRARRVFCEDGSVLEADAISLDTGSTPGGFGVQGVEEYARPVKPIERFVTDWESLFFRLREGSAPRIAVVGAGAAGCELIMAMHHRLGTLNLSGARFTLVSNAPSVLPGAPRGGRRRILSRLDAKGIAVKTGTPAVRIEPKRVVLADGSAVNADFAVWATGSSPPEWPKAAGLACDPSGFVLVDRHLQSTSHPGIFAAGDVATMEGAPRPKSGVYAVRAGPPLAANLRAALEGRPLEPYRPQRRALALIGTGGRHAIGLWGPLAWEGRWVWTWKDRIDRGFVARFAMGDAGA